MMFRSTVLIVSFLTTPLLMASGGYDNGTPAGAGNVDIDITWNPFDVFDKGQSYVVWGYGLTDKVDFHGYVTHEASSKTNHIYMGFMDNVFQNKCLDLSTAYGIRYRKDEYHSYFPQLLYTFKLPSAYELAGSVVNVYNHSKEKNLGVSCDIALRVPLRFSGLPKMIKETKFSIGAFKSASGSIYPTYSVDFKF